MYKKIFTLREDEELKILGKEIIINQFKNQKIRFSDENLKTILNNFNLENNEDLFLKVGNGELIPSKDNFVIISRKKLVESNDKIILLNEVKEKRKKKTSVLLKGLTPGMSVHYANCCNPIPGDSVIAFIITARV